MDRNDWRVLYVRVSNKGGEEKERVIYESQVTIGKSEDDNIRLPYELATTLPDNFFLFTRDEHNVYRLYSCEALEIMVWPWLFAHPRTFRDVEGGSGLKLGNGAHGEIQVKGTGFTVHFRVDKPPPERP